MDAVLLDTDVFSYLTKSNDPRGEAYRPHVKGKTVAISFVTVGEFYFGAEKKKWSGKTLSNFLERLKAVVIVPYDIELCKTYGKLKASLQGAGVSVSDNDLWIAACAVRHSIPLISNNRKHFEKIPGLHLISESPQKTAPVPATKKLFDPTPPEK
jgi:tRNA(fMet)-specific endonuclease VapC